MSKIDKKGFTLIELLAVIVIIAVIAIITVPLILNIVGSSKQGALKDSDYGIIKAGEFLAIQNFSDDLFEVEESRYDFQVIIGRFVYVKDHNQTLPFNGAVPKTGILQIYTDGKTAIAVCNDENCACKSANEFMVTIKNTNCSIDPDTGEIVDNSPSGGSVPVGTIISYMGMNAPEGYLFCDGSIYNINDYPNLANQIKEEFGLFDYFGGDGVTTFAVPNLQGEFLRGYSSSLSASVTQGVTTAAVGRHQAATQIPNIWVYGSGNQNTLVVDMPSLGATNKTTNADLNLITTQRVFKDIGYSTYSTSSTESTYE